MERVEDHNQDELIELGVATVETKGGGPNVEFIGGLPNEGLSDQ